MVMAPNSFTNSARGDDALSGFEEESSSDEIDDKDEPASPGLRTSEYD